MTKSTTMSLLANPYQAFLYNEKSNIRDRSGILLDHERAPYIKQMFEKVANGYMTGRDIY